MNRHIEEVTIQHVDDPMGDERHTHPAFAQIGANRVSGGATLYGSDFNHQNYISIRIAKSSLRRSLSNDWLVADLNPYIEVDLSEAQWATFVSSLNVGQGVACTLRYRNGEGVARLPNPESRKDQFTKEARETCAESIDRINDLCAMIEATGLSKKAKEELQKQAQRAASSMTSSLPFVMDQFGEHMEQTTEKAKIEINAYATSAVMRAGIAALGDQTDSLPLIEFAASKPKDAE
jgi:gas vesicle protein